MKCVCRSVLIPIAGALNPIVNTEPKTTSRILNQYYYRKFRQMQKMKAKTGDAMAKIPTIIDNRNGNTVLNTLNQLLLNLKKLDIATGYFEVGSFL